jgi:hypothetical protein
MTLLSSQEIAETNDFAICGFSLHPPFPLMVNSSGVSGAAIKIPNKSYSTAFCRGIQSVQFKLSCCLKTEKVWRKTDSTIIAENHLLRDESVARKRFCESAGSVRLPLRRSFAPQRRPCFSHGSPQYSIYRPPRVLILVIKKLWLALRGNGTIAI